MFGRLDPTTAIHACRKVQALKESECQIQGGFFQSAAYPVSLPRRFFDKG
jgi:hypothetical protein